MRLKLSGLAEGIDHNDDIKLFIKDEPLSDKKKAQNRERLIFCLSLEDQIVDHMLFDETVLSEVASASVTNSKVGWSPIPTGFLLFYHTFSLDDVVSVDKSAWDWTMPAYIPYCYFKQRFSHWSPLGQAIAWRRFNQVIGTSCVLRCPDGRRLRQTGYGIMKSGWLLTIGMNSAAQVYQHYLAQIRSGSPPRRLWSCGDDVIMEKSTKEYYVQLSLTGCILKHVKTDAEFMGMSFEPGHVLQPIYPDRHAFSMAYADVELLPQLAIGLLSWYALARDREVVRPLESYSVLPAYCYKWWAYGLLDLAQH